MIAIGPFESSGGAICPAEISYSIRCDADVSMLLGRVPNLQHSEKYIKSTATSDFQNKKKCIEGL